MVKEMCVGAGAANGEMGNEEKINERQIYELL